MFLPRGLSVIADARSALSRLQNIFHAELMEKDPITVDPSLPYALLIRDASFEWEEAILKDDNGENSTEKSSDAPFQLNDVNIKIERGTLVAVVGRVGSGKSSLLQAAIGEMRKVKGDVTFGGSIAYCPQTAWIQNASLVSVKANSEIERLTS